MAKPPPAPPASDIDGIDQDEFDNVDAAIEAGQDSADLKRARDEAAARPDYSDEAENRDDRSR